MSEPVDSSSPATSPDPTAATAKPAFTQPIVALPHRGFFLKRMLIATVVLGVAAYFLYDGFVGYPTHNEKVRTLDAQVAAAEGAKNAAEADKLNRQRKELGPVHQDRDILLQKIIGFALIPLGLFLLAKFLREGRGELRLENDTLHVPGHPPIPIHSLTGLNNARWDKKGIAIFDYKLADGTIGQFKIDDFVFDRPPTDAIHDEVLAKMPKSA